MKNNINTTKKTKVLPILIILAILTTCIGFLIGHFRKKINTGSVNKFDSVDNLKREKVDGINKILVSEHDGISSIFNINIDV